jgi:hypothetical protein
LCAHRLAVIVGIDDDHSVANYKFERHLAGIDHNAASLRGSSPCAIDAGINTQIIDAKSIATIKWRACFINDPNSVVLPQPGRVARGGAYH